MIVAAVDSAESCGLAVVEAGPEGLRLLHTRVAVIRPDATAADIEQAVDELADHGPDLAVVEDVYLRSAARGGNPAAVLALAKLAGRWTQALERRGIPTITVLASTWQPAVLAIQRFAPRADRKAAAQELARQRFGVALSEDAADAAAIAIWGVRHAGARPPAPPAPRHAKGVTGDLF